MPGPEGPKSVTVWRVRDRGTFEALRRHGHRSRRGPVTVTFLADETTGPARVAYAVGRSVGSAVRRNRLRRRLRAAVRELEPQPGAYLVGAGAAATALAYAELKSNLRAAMDAATDRASSSAPS